MKDPEKYIEIEEEGSVITKKKKITGLFPTRGLQKVQDTLYFGKYYKQKIKNIAQTDPQYLRWVITTDKIKKHKQTVESIKYWLRKYNQI